MIWDSIRPSRETASRSGGEAASSRCISLTFETGLPGMLLDIILRRGHSNNKVRKDNPFRRTGVSARFRERNRNECLRADPRLARLFRDPQRARKAALVFGLRP